jgi:hypothetical protein
MRVIVKMIVMVIIRVKIVYIGVIVRLVRMLKMIVKVIVLKIVYISVIVRLVSVRGGPLNWT